MDENKHYMQMEKVDVLLFLYLVHRSEGSSCPFTEALALGKPVMMTAKSCLSDQLKNLMDGVLRLHRRKW